MKKNILHFTCIALFCIALAACSNNPTSKATTDSSVITGTTPGSADTTMGKQTAVVYTCKMHPEVVSNKPGKCPTCGMELVKRSDLVKEGAMKDMKMDSTKH